MQADATPEDQLILLLARGALTPHVQAQALVLLAMPLRWDLILEGAVAHEVYPLLYRNLRRVGFPGVPADVCIKLEALYKVNAFRNAHLAEELARVLQLLEGAGIPTIPLKGVTLAESLYGDATLRVCADIDILVPRPMVTQAFRLLLARGYRAEFSEQFFADLFLRHDIEYALMRKERGVSYLLELHWEILWGAPWDGDAPQDLWAEAHPQTFFGVPAHAFSPEWDLLFLAAHAARHQWQGLKWLVDIHEVCCGREIDWEKAERLGWEEVLRLTLSACHALFDTPIPAPFSPRSLPPWVKLFPLDPSPSAIWDGALFPTRLLARPSEKLRYVVRVFFVPTIAERRLCRFPSLLSFLYYPLRPLRLGCKWGWRLVYASFQRLRAMGKSGGIAV